MTRQEFLDFWRICCLGEREREGERERKRKKIEEKEGVTKELKEGGVNSFENLKTLIHEQGKLVRFLGCLFPCHLAHHLFDKIPLLPGLMSWWMVGVNKVLDNSNSMPAEGDLTGGGTSQSMQSSKPERLYKVWPGNNVYTRPYLRNFQIMICSMWAYWIFIPMPYVLYWIFY